MAFTSGNDINILQEADTAIVGAGLGNDTYILSTATLSPGQSITISDSGTNTLQLVDGLSINSSMVTNNAIQLTLSNNAVITILDCASFNFDVGGNALVGPGDIQDFSTFVTTTLGIDEVPAPGENAVSGGSITIGDPIDPTNIIDLVEGSSEPVYATDAVDVITFDTAVALADADATNTQITIYDFDTDADSLQLDIITALGATTLDQLNGVDGIVVQANTIEGYMLVNFGNDNNGGEIVTLKLAGVTDAGQINVDAI